MALDRPYDDGRVQTANVGIRSSTVSANVIPVDDIIFMFRAKRPLYLRYFRLDETAETCISDQRVRRNTAELQTSGAKRAETWRGGRASHRLGGSVGGRDGDREGGLKDEAGIRAIELQPDFETCLLYTSPSPRDLSTSRMPSSA